MRNVSFLIFVYNKSSAEDIENMLAKIYLISKDESIITE